MRQASDIAVSNWITGNGHYNWNGICRPHNSIYGCAESNDNDINLGSNEFLGENREKLKSPFGEAPLYAEADIAPFIRSSRRRAAEDVREPWRS
jgi:hypothetical protein